MKSRSLLVALLVVAGVLAAPWSPGPGFRASATPVAGGPAADSTDAVKRVRLLLHNRYRYGGLASLKARANQMDALQLYCDGSRGFICTGGDPDAGPCEVGGACHLPEGHLVDVLRESAQTYPASGFLSGQAVYVLVKFARNVEAMALADACQAEHWFCEALKGYVLDSDGRTRAAEEHLRTAMTEAPDSVRCAYTDATWLVGSWEQRNLSLVPPDARADVKDWSCDRIEAVSDTLWWLADPFYSVPGNERWTEHVVRSLSARFAAEIRTSSPPERAPREYPAYLWARRVRRGVWDSWEHLRSPRGYDHAISTVVWTSEARAEYHFMPDVEVDDLDHPTWSLEAHRDDEGYTPDLGPVDAMPVQIARFRASDSLEVAGAASLAGTTIAGALNQTTRLVLTDGPGSFPASVPGDVTRRSTPVFIARAPAARYVVGVEAVTSRGGGFHREILEPLDDGTSAVSDLLLYDPDGVDPATVKEAAGSMLGSVTVSPGAHIGVFWQTYGVPEGATLHFDLSLERESGRLVDQFRRLLEGRSESAHGRLSWTEAGVTDTDTRSVVLDLGDLDDGNYTLVLQVSWEGHPPMEQRRILDVG